MEPLNKLILNNKIVKLRHCVRRSRLHCINKMVKQIRKLKAKNGTEEQKEKNLKKADRYFQEISTMKKTKDDAVSKFALLNERNATDIMGDIKESIENKALARLSSHKLVMEQIYKFREQYPKWKDLLPSLFLTLGEKHQNDKKPLKSVFPVHNTKQGIKKINEFSKLGKPTLEYANKRRQIIAIKGQDKVQTDKVISPNISSSENEDDSYIEEQSFDNRIGRNVVSSKMENYMQSKRERVKTFTRHNKEERKNEEKEIIKECAVDPFFITKDDKAYVSVYKPAVDDISDSSVSNFKNNNIFKPKKSLKRTSYIKCSSTNIMNANKPSPSLDVPLHPSWEAKKKQQNIASFQGKKIKFD